MNFEGKTAVITGASSGIGLGYAHEFAKRGANLVLVSRSGSVLEVLADELKAEYQDNVDVIELDLSNLGSGQELLKELSSKKLKPSIVVGGRNSFMAHATRFIPQKAVIKVAGKLFLRD